MTVYATKVLKLSILLIFLPFSAKAQVFAVANAAASYTEQTETIVTTPQHEVEEESRPYKIKSKKIVLTQLKPLTVNSTAHQGVDSSVGLTIFTRDGHPPCTGMSANIQF